MAVTVVRLSTYVVAVCAARTTHTAVRSMFVDLAVKKICIYMIPAYSRTLLPTSSAFPVTVETQLRPAKNHNHVNIHISNAWNSAKGGVCTMNLESGYPVQIGELHGVRGFFLVDVPS